MNSLTHRHLTLTALNDLIELSSSNEVALTLEQRTALARRFQSITSVRSRRLDAWSVESAGAKPSPFRWTPARAKRPIGLGALRRQRRQRELNVTEAVRQEIDELFVRAAAGYAQPGSLARWLADQHSPVISLTVAEAVTWATTALEVLEPIRSPWSPCEADAFYDVSAARTTLRGRRDATALTPTGRVVIRFRNGQPGKSAGPGLRADLVVEALSHPEGVLAQQFVGVWPDAGIVLAIDGTIENARSGARDLIRTAEVQYTMSRSLAA